MLRPRSYARQEVRAGSTGPVRVWLDRLVASATFVVSDPDGRQVGSGAASIVNLGIPQLSRLDCAVPSGLDLWEGYMLYATVDGQQVDPPTPFDVVRWTYGPSPTLDEILDVRTQAHSALEAAAQVRGCSVEDYVRHVVGPRARAKLETMVRSQLPTDPYLRRARPYAILDTDRIHRVEILLAVATLYEARMTGQQDDSAGVLAERYHAEAQADLRAMGPFRVDVNVDGLADEHHEPRSVVFTRRPG